jgi:hypothetical protein
MYNWFINNFTLVNITLLAALLVLVLIAWAIIRVMGQEKFKIEYLLSEGTEGGKPSVSRLQMLIWNFVIAFAFLYVLASNQLDKIQNLLKPEVLILLGISNGTYYLAKLKGPAPSAPSAPSETQTPESRAGQPPAPGEPSAGPGPQGTQ